jgi:hypothetical protein
MSAQQRTISMPQLLSKDGQDKPVPNVNKPSLYGPPKPPRTAIGMGNMDRAEIRTALQNWQMGLMMNDQENKTEKRPQQYAAGLLRTGRSLGDGKAAQSDIPGANGIYQKKANVRRREPRRHTLQNGIDYNMLKRMKQIEQEKDVLMQGLNAVEKAREWYLKQVAAVQEKMKYLGRMGHVVSSLIYHFSLIKKSTFIYVMSSSRINAHLWSKKSTSIMFVPTDPYSPR